MDMISVRQAPELAPRAIAYFQRHWATAETLMMYERRHQPQPGAANPLPQWYLLMENDQILGCGGLSPTTLSAVGSCIPGLCARREAQRLGHGAKLIEHVAAETRRLGFPQLHLVPIWRVLRAQWLRYYGLGVSPLGRSLAGLFAGVVFAACGKTNPDFSFRSPHSHRGLHWPLVRHRPG